MPNLRARFIDRQRALGRAWVAAVGALVIAGVMVPAAQADDDTASLSGVVTDVATHEPLQGAEIDIQRHDSDGWTEADKTTTDSTGAWTSSGLAAGTYRIEAVDTYGFYASQFLGADGGVDDEFAAADVALSQAQNLTGQDIALPAAATAAGKVTVGGRAAQFVTVTAYRQVDVSNNAQFDSGWVADGIPVQTDGLGSFKIPGLHGGKHTLEVTAENRSTPTYLGGGSERDSAATFVQDIGTDSDSHDIALPAPDWVLAGTVTGTNGAKLADIGVAAYAKSDAGAIASEPAGTQTTDQDGHFAFASLPRGNYVLEFTPSSDGAFAHTYSGGTSDISDADIVQVDEGVATTADITLEPASAIQVKSSDKTVREIDVYDASGALVEAVTANSTSTTVRGLPEGSYFLGFNQGVIDEATDSAFLAAVYRAGGNNLPDGSDVTQGTPVVVAVGATFEVGDVKLGFGGVLRRELGTASGLAGCSVSAVAADSVSHAKRDGRVSDAGVVSIAGLSTGSYRLQTKTPCAGQPAGRYLTSTNASPLTSSTASSASFAVTAPLDGAATAQTAVNVSQVPSSVRVGQRIGTGLTPSPSTATGVYQWYVGDAPIENATGKELAVPVSALGKSLSVTVTWSASGLAPTTASYVVDAKVDPGILSAPTPRITGRAKAGSTVKVSTGTWRPTATLAYRWYANGKAIRGATASRYRIERSMVGRRLSVHVSGRATGYETKVVGSARTAPVRR